LLGSADVEIATYSNENALVVPIQAIVQRDGQEAVFVVDEADSKARAAQVVTGLTDAIGVEILEGIEAGDCVVIGDYDALKQLGDGKQVRLGKVK
jgi:multidrug efflux pump subunit AcrA (membrane-fusion protein)